MNGLAPSRHAIAGMLIAALLGVATAVQAAAPCETERGAVVFADKCAICHSAEPTGRSIVGPPLFGIVGRRPASIAGFAYSAAMASRTDPWSPALLDWYLLDPPGRVPGTYMAFSGLKNDAARAAVICFLGAAAAARPN